MNNFSTNTTGYRGRFAPSPTGPLHFGSLVAAVGSYLQARHCNGRWLVRIEDLDPPREVPGSDTLILQTLDSYGLHWDEEVCYQSKRSEAYVEALERLHASGVVYPCHCSRKQIAKTLAASGGQQDVYPGTCRTLTNTLTSTSNHGGALRINTESQELSFKDIIQGRFHSALEQQGGDFIVRRADGLFSYQLAVVVDDAAYGISEVVRGCDLLDLTSGQIYLQKLLGVPTPSYLHLPVAINKTGEKLSKQTFARPLEPDNPLPELWQALYFLGQNPPTELKNSNLDEFWEWAHHHWTVNNIPRIKAQTPPQQPTDQWV